MYKVTKETLNKAYKPFDVVSDTKGNVGIIQEVSVNDSQVGFDDQISYAIKWLVSNESKHAWFDHDELQLHCNMLIVIAECACHPFGRNEGRVQALFNEMSR